MSESGGNKLNTSVNIEISEVKRNGMKSVKETNIFEKKNNFI